MNEVHYAGPGPQEKPPKAFENPAFLRSDEGRAVRLLSEFIEPQVRFERQGIHQTIVLFGSARILPPETAAERLAAAEASGDATKVERARVASDLSRFYAEARDLSGRLTRWSNGLPEASRFAVCSGGGPGIMEAANRGCIENGGRSIGLNINIPWEQKANPYISPGLGFEFHYFLMRKFWFNYLARAVVVFPGGFGTLDELFELATLIKTERNNYLIPIVLYGTEYWDSVLNMERMKHYGTINDEELALFQRADDVDTAFQFVVQSLTEKFLRRP